MDNKPIKAKPIFYAMCYEQLKIIAKEHGYNLILHGSLNRDFDLIAIQWVDEPKSERDMIIEFDKYLRGMHFNEESFEHGYMYSVLPGGRNSYVINLNRAGRWNSYNDDPEWYLDISVIKSNLN